jgi:hypothetical protein
MDQNKLKYFNIFKAQYQIIKEFSPKSGAEELYNKAITITDSFTNYETTNQKIDTKIWKVELYNEYVGLFEVPSYTILTDQPTDDWYQINKKQGRFFWMRYKHYLSRLKNWPQLSIDTIDNTTDDIMGFLGNPKSNVPFDKRGLVLGYVQSGKTANFTGLVNKAFDSGYDLVVVLSGIHNDLRAQTQMRLEEEVVGISSQQLHNKKIGVANITENDSSHFIHTLTTVENDISNQKVFASYNFKKNKTMMVVKKNKDVLTSLHSLLDTSLKQINEHVSLLVIDDEADQASIDTNEAGEATTINRLIRQILELFSQKAYVGYTATPFANLLINSVKETLNEGLDLYPKDFLVGLPKPKGYCGPDEFFNTEEDADDIRPSLVVHLNKTDIDMFNQIKKAEHANKFSEVPPQMREAIKSFLIATTIRELRNQVNEHNSMLIHTSRFKDVQSNIKEEVAKAFKEMANEIELYPDGETVKSIAELYNAEFVSKTEQWNRATNEEYVVFEWPEIYKRMKKVVTKINVMEINGNSKDALEYNRYKENGLYVIAVGGEKLSRGLTLEGLTISYYYRNTLMYDTLMQMGRWFGFRKGYMDLCRIYTSETIASNFEHLAVAMRELREEFDKMKNSEKTPLEFAIRMLAHPSMTLTSPLKMRTARVSHTLYRKSLQQTRLFGTNESFYRNNMNATINLINSIYESFYLFSSNNRKSATKYYVADQIPVENILNFLKEYETKSEDKVNANRISDYIKMVHDKFNELNKWKVVVVEGIPDKKNPPVNLGKLKIKHTVLRGNRQGASGRDSYTDRVDIKAIVAAGQEFFYLSEKVNDKEEVRNNMPKEVGVMIIYPLNPCAAAFKHIDDHFTTKFSRDLIPIGVAFSFPDSELDESKIYQINKSIGT